MRVLVADDSLVVRRHLVELLSELPRIEVVGPAADVSQALELYHRHRPRAAVLDIRMPGGSGLDVLGRIKAHDPSCVVIMLTSHALAEFRPRCRELGADFLFHKATEFEKVAEVLRAVRDMPPPTHLRRAPEEVP